MHPKRRATSLIFLLPLALLLHCSSEPKPVIKTADGATMLLIPAGEFLMGGKEEDLVDRPNSGYLNYEAERPLHTVKLSAFYLDKFEVTNAQYERFLDATDQGKDRRYAHPDQPDNVDYRRRYIDDTYLGEQQPAVGLNWYDAYAYCNWAEKRLPTEAEWEYAARGNDGYRKYPWGDNDPDADGIWWANYYPPQGRSADGFRVTAPVGSFPDGVSPFGLMDMSGNAEEWVHDWLSFNYYRRTDGAQDPTGPLEGTKKVIKGGSFGTDRHHIRIATRLYGKPNDKGQYQGFRCARSL